MKLSFVVHTLDRAAGGVTSAVEELACAMKALGHECRIISFDDPKGFKGSDEVESIAIGPRIGSYGYIPNLQNRLRAHDTDIFILNGLWLHSTHGVGRWARANNIPYVVFPHGMLDPYFRKFPLKHLKKLLYYTFFERSTLVGAKAICYTTQSEKKLAQNTFPLFTPKRQEVVGLGLESSPYEPEAAKENFYSHFPALRDKQFLLHMGRFHPKKGCDMLLKALHDFPSLELVMAGPLHGAQAAYIRKLHDLAAAAGSRVHWTGMLTGELKWGALSAAKGLILPSHQENFGMVVAEALSIGTPVYISDKVALCHEVLRERCGFVQDDTFEGTRSLLRAFSHCSAIEHSQLSVNARNCFESNFLPAFVARRFENLLINLLNPAQAPSCE